jgi:hypothetical protein
MSLLDDFKTGAPDNAPVVFDSTLKSFDIEAMNLKRGFQVNQSLNSLRTLGQLNRELKSPKTHSYTAISYQPAQHQE